MLPAKRYTMWKGLVLFLVPTVLCWNLIGPASWITVIVALFSWGAALLWNSWSNTKFVE